MIAKRIGVGILRTLEDCYLQLPASRIADPRQRWSCVPFLPGDCAYHPSSADVRLPKEDVRQPREDVRQSREDVRQSREDVREPREDVRQRREDVRLPHEDVRLPQAE